MYHLLTDALGGRVIASRVSEFRRAYHGHTFLFLTHSFSLKFAWANKNLRATYKWPLSRLTTGRQRWGTRHLVTPRTISREFHLPFTPVT